MKTFPQNSMNQAGTIRGLSFGRAAAWRHPWLFIALALMARALPAAAQTQTNYQQLMFFDAGRSWGANPLAGVVLGPDGTLYGGTTVHSDGNYGAVFAVKPDASGHRTVFSFPAGAPLGGLMAASDGTIYGTTESGGDFFNGSVFKVNPDGGGFTNLYSFGATQGDGGNVLAGVVFGRDGALYGTTDDDSTTNRCGIVFKVNPDGTGYRILHQFSTNAVNGATVDARTPRAKLLVGRDGALYGTAAGGGSALNFPFGPGAVFKLNPDGTGYTILHSFVFSDGYNSQTELIQDANGMLYGTTAYGGPDDSGVIFTLNTNGTGFSMLYNLTTSIYGTTAGASGLALGADGALYGSTLNGGNTNAANPGGMGTVFRVNTNGTGYTNLYGFHGEDGRNPAAGLTLAADGALYGTTEFGGYFNQGVVFKLSSSPPGNLSIIDIVSTSAGFLLTSSGAPMQGWAVQNKTNLQSTAKWQILTNASTDAYGLFQYLDARATNSATGFYRAASAP